MEDAAKVPLGHAFLLALSFARERKRGSCRVCVCVCVWGGGGAGLLQRQVKVVCAVFVSFVKCENVLWQFGKKDSSYWLEASATRYQRTLRPSVTRTGGVRILSSHSVRESWQLLWEGSVFWGGERGGGTDPSNTVCSSLQFHLIIPAAGQSAFISQWYTAELFFVLPTCLAKVLKEGWEIILLIIFLCCCICLRFFGSSEFSGLVQRLRKV